MSPEDLSALAQGRAFQWHELCVPDIDGAAEFYSTALGFEATEAEMGDAGMYRMLTRDGRPVCGLQSTSEGSACGMLPHWATYLWVDDVDARLAKCVELGAEVIQPAISVQTVGRMALIRDPQGATIWLFKGE